MNGNYRVIWRRELSDRRLADIVVRTMERGDDVNAITEAVSTIDRLLATRPESCGESRSEYERVVIIEPLTATYEVHEEEKIVFVIDLHYHRPRPH
jgi:hypothetical protein